MSYTNVAIAQVVSCHKADHSTVRKADRLQIARTDGTAMTKTAKTAAALGMIVLLGSSTHAHSAQAQTEQAQTVQAQSANTSEAASNESRHYHHYLAKNWAKNEVKLSGAQASESEALAPEIAPEIASEITSALSPMRRQTTQTSYSAPSFDETSLRKTIQTLARSSGLLTDYNGLSASDASYSSTAEGALRCSLLVYVSERGEVSAVNIEFPRQYSAAMNRLAVSTFIAQVCKTIQKSSFTPAYRNDVAVSAALELPLKVIL
jgi:hypothetical protein